MARGGKRAGAGRKRAPNSFKLTIQLATTPLESNALLWFVGRSGETKERKERIVTLYQLWIENEKSHCQNP